MSYYKIGFHTGPGGNRTGLNTTQEGNGYFQSLDSHGIPATVKSVDDYGPCEELAAYERVKPIGHNIIFRLSTAGQNDGFDYDVPKYNLEPGVAAAIHWQATLAKLPPEFDKELVWLEVINEVDKERSDWLGYFGYEIAQLAMEQGYKILLFGWSSGEPETHHWLTDGMQKFLRLAAANKDKLGVALHEYSYKQNVLLEDNPIWLVGRFIHLFAAVDSVGIVRPTVFITEFGWTHTYTPGPTTARIQLYQAAALYAEYDDIRAVAIWYLGAGFGGIADRAQKLISVVTQASLAWKGIPTETVYTKGIDISHWNGDLDGAVCAEAGNEFVIVKATDGYVMNSGAKGQARYQDALFVPNTNRAVSAGLIVGAYHYFRPNMPPENQWLYFLEALSQVETQNLPPILDFEEDAPEGMPYSEVRDDMISWLEAVEHETNQTPFIYTNQDFYNRYLCVDRRFDRFPLMVANYTSAQSPAMPSCRDKWEIWQWDSGLGGPENGVQSTNVDKDRWPGLPQAFVEKYGRNWMEEEMTRDQDMWNKTIQEQIDHGLQLADTAIQNAIRSHGMHPVTKEMYIPGYPPMMAAEDWNDRTRPRRVYIWENGQVRWFNDPFETTPEPPPPSGSAIDLLPYFIPVPNGNGPLYEVRRADGSQERIQTQVIASGQVFYITKGTGGLNGKSEFETLAWDNDYIWRGLDTSPGNMRFYVQYEPGMSMARWVKRHMKVGETWTGPGHHVQFFYKGGCGLSSDNSGPSTNQTKLFALHLSLTFNGLVINDVIEIGREGGERFWFARGLGLVGWKSDWNESYISEIHAPGQRPDNQRESVCNYTLP